MRGLSPDDLKLHVPACPDWTCLELIAHVAGVAADVATGNVAGAGKAEWTAAHVAARRDRSTDQIISEPVETGAMVEGALEFIHPAAAGLFVGDIISHEQDLRGAIGAPGARNTLPVHIGVDT